MRSFKEQFGFERAEVSLDNWKDSPFSTWSFQNVSELIPVAPVRGADIPHFHPVNFSNFQLPANLDGFIASTYTDALLVSRRGVKVFEYFAPHFDRTASHLVFSISKSLTGLLAGALQSRTTFDVEKRVSHFVPEAKSGAYADCTVRHLLDMLVSVDFNEAYAETDGPYARYRRSMLWMPEIQNDEKFRENLLESILSLPKGENPHGKIFNYRSPNSDLLGLVLERVSGTRFPELLSQLIWDPMEAHGASITVDKVGMSRTAGGISCLPTDLLRLGELFLAMGASEKGRQIVSESWIYDTMNGGSVEAWQSGDFFGLLPQGKYRNQWYSVGEGAFCAIGIHGQWLFVDSRSQTVVVKVSSQPVADDDSLDVATLSMMRLLTSELG